MKAQVVLSNHPSKNQNHDTQMPAATSPRPKINMSIQKGPFQKEIFIFQPIDFQYIYIL